MKYLLHFFYNNAAGGASTYAVPLINENGQVVAGNDWTAPEDCAITRVSSVSTVGAYSTIARSAHPGDDLSVPTLADTGADFAQVLDLEKMLGGSGVVVKKNEKLIVTSTLTGNGLTNVVIELDSKVPGGNHRLVQVAGAAAAVADVFTETGGNFRAAAVLNPLTTYVPKAVYAHSTTLHQAAIGLANGGLSFIQGHTALLLGHRMTVLARSVQNSMRASGGTYQSQFRWFVKATAADAAAVQRLFMLLEAL